MENLKKFKIGKKYNKFLLKCKS